MTEVAARDDFLALNPAVRGLQELVDDLAARDRHLDVLEAGCGSASYVEFGGRARVVGIDVSERQLSRHPELDERILGDIETHNFHANSFDLIVCWDVLEHLRRPRRAVANLAKALRPGGLLVLALPNVLSLKGLVTKFTPHRFHVWVYRHVFGWPHAGTDDHGPFPTFLRFSVAPSALRDLGVRLGLEVAYFAPYESWSQEQVRRRAHLTGARWEIVRRSVRVLTLGRVTPELTEYILVLRRP
jgi:SAM-dependent methyltransferase